ncbi:hypothetical protein Q7C36_009223 [Tachysurus vachellii]|uniref:Uncharacterized protein n=1 Tax=Tachysurus vachellii TaxID=175792 RepID=A0AA88SUE7_TACVA|nr:hypothetical protein Q7C36_009223 [Tachysurus vachellii]
MSMSSHYFRSGADLDLKGCWILVAPSGVKGLRVSFRALARWGRLASPGNVIPACEVACEWQGLPLEGKNEMQILSCDFSNPLDQILLCRKEISHCRISSNKKLNLKF